jgi:hypothetical protein
VRCLILYILIHSLTYCHYLYYLRSLLVYSPAHRASPTEALRHPYLHQTTEGDMQSAKSNASGAVSSGDGSAGAATSDSAHTKSRHEEGVKSNKANESVNKSPVRNEDNMQPPEKQARKQSNVASLKVQQHRRYESVCAISLYGSGY